MTGRKNGRHGRAGARTPTIAALAVLIGLVFGVVFPAADATLANRVGGPGLALLYTFDANAGTVVADQTGAGGAKGDPWDQTLNRGYWLTDLGSPLPSGVLINETCVPPCAPPINNATAVTGKLDSITELVSLFASTNAEFSVEAWVEPTDANTAGIIFDSHVAGGADESFACVPGDATFGGDSISLRQVANGTYVCIVGDNGGTPAATECTAADTITAGGRYHVVATVDAASAVTLYVNGAATAAVCTPTATSFGGYATAWAANATERQVSIGARGNGFGTFLGNVHLVAFYTEALNSSEVLRNYETGAFNEAPVPVSAAYNYTEDGNLTVALTATDSDPRDSASFVVTSLPVAGSLFQLSGVGVKGAAIAVNDTVTSPNGELLFEPSPNANGDQTFTFSASDGVDTSTADGVITLTGLAVDDASIVTAPATATTIDRVVTVNDIVVSDVDGGNVTVSVAVSNGTVTLRNTTNIVSFTTGDGVDDATVVFTVDTTSTSSTHDFDLVYTANCVTFTRTDAITVMAATPGNVFGMPAITAVDIPFVLATVMPTMPPPTLELGATANINVSISALPQCNPDVVLTPVSTPVDTGVVTFVPAALTYNTSIGPLMLQLTGDTLGTATLSFTASNGEVDVGGAGVNVTVVPVPTTVAPTTVAPTTVAPTTVAPTTVAPTTVAPTTAAPTTAAPTTTAGPTTTTTLAPTTTTASPTTTAGPTTTSTTVTPTTTSTEAPISLAQFPDCAANIRGFYVKDGACFGCPEGAFCPGDTRVWPVEGWWSPNETTPPVRCSVKLACPGALGERAGYPVEDGLDGRVTDQCADGFVGEYCATCAADYFDDAGFCRACRESPATFFILGLVFAVAMFLLCAAALGGLVDGVPFDIFVTAVLYAQIFIMIGRRGTEMLADDHALTTVFRVLSIFTFDMDYFQRACNGLGSGFVGYYWSTLLLFAIMGVVVAVGTVIRGVVLKSRMAKRSILMPWAQAVTRRLVRALIGLTVVIYLRALYNSLEALECYDGATDDDPRRLRADLTVECYAGSHTLVAVLSWLVVVFFGVGFPAGMVVLVRWLRRTGRYEDNEETVDELIGFFTRSTRHWWYFFRPFFLALLYAAVIGLSVAKQPQSGIFLAGCAMLLDASFAALLTPFRAWKLNAMHLMASLGVGLSVALWLGTVDQNWAYFIIFISCYALMVLITAVSMSAPEDTLLRDDGGKGSFAGVPMEEIDPSKAFLPITSILGGVDTPTAASRKRGDDDAPPADGLPVIMADEDLAFPTLSDPPPARNRQPDPETAVPTVAVPTVAVSADGGDADNDEAPSDDPKGVADNAGAGNEKPPPSSSSSSAESSSSVEPRNLDASGTVDLVPV